MNVGDEKGTDFSLRDCVFSCMKSYPCLTPLCVLVPPFFFCFFFAPGCILDSVVSEVNPAAVLELGTYCGYSTVRIASLLPPHAKLITLEFNPDFAAIARQVIAWAGLEEKVKQEVSTETDIKKIYVVCAGQERVCFFLLPRSSWLKGRLVTGSQRWRSTLGWKHSI